MSPYLDIRFGIGGRVGRVDHLSRHPFRLAFGRITGDSPLVAEGAPSEGTVVVTSIDGERIVSQSDFQRVMDAREQGEEVSVVGYLDGQREAFTVAVGADGLGVNTSPGVGGLTVTDFGVRYYPAGAFLEILGGSVDGETGAAALGLPQRIFTMLLLPFAGVASGLGYNFPGFTGFWTSFYEVGGVVGTLGDGTGFLLANVLFWTGWINLLIGQFNLVPTFPLDGGHLLRASVESVVARLPIEGKHSLTTAVTGAITITMIVSLLMMVFAPRLLT